MTTYVSAAIFDAVKDLGLQRTMQFMNWFSHGVDLAKSGQSPDAQFTAMQSEYFRIDTEMQAKLPAGTKAGLVLPLDEVSIAYLENAGAPFAQLHQLATDAYKGHYGHAPTKLSHMPSFCFPLSQPTLQAAGHLVSVGHARMPRA